MTKHYFNINELNLSLNSIIKEQEKKLNIKLNLSLISKIQYYKTDTFKKKFKLTKNIIITPFISKGIYFLESNETYVFLNFINKKLISPNKLPKLLHTIFHEIKHYHQSNAEFTYTNFEKFIFFMEKIVQLHNPTDYHLNYHKYYSEIDANYYAINELELYLDKNNPLHQKYIDYHKKRYNYQLKTYDPEQLFENFHKILQNKIHFYNYTHINPFLKIFYNYNATFKPLNEIMNELKKYKLDWKITETIISSNSFLNQLDITNLSQTEKDFLNVILSNKYSELILKKEITDSYFMQTIDFEKEFLSKKQPISSKINYLKYRFIDHLEDQVDSNEIASNYKNKTLKLLNKINEIDK